MEENNMIDLYNGDCLEVMDKLIEQGVKVDYTFTSPPYNRKRNDKYLYFNDSNKNWFEWNCEVIDRLLILTKKHVFYNLQSNYYNRNDVYKIIGKYNDKIKDIHIWEKTNSMPASGKSITNAVEYFIILGDINIKSNKTYTKNIISTSVNSKMPKEHKAVMKQSVSDYFIKNFTQQNDIILDCFLGIGTTGISCKNLNRNFIGIELDKKYFDIAKERIEKEGNQTTLF